MSHDEFDVYRTIIDDTNHLNLRRQAQDALYAALITFTLTGDGYVAFYARFDSWLPVLLTAAVAVIGVAIIARWRQALKDLDEILKNRYAFLRSMEANPQLSGIGATIFTDEYGKIYQSREAGRFRSATKRLQRIFIAVFLLIPIVLAALTAANLIPGIHDVVSPYLGPLIPVPTPTK